MMSPRIQGQILQELDVWFLFSVPRRLLQGFW